jgi:HEAT repeat protein
MKPLIVLSLMLTVALLGVDQGTVPTKEDANKQLGKLKNSKSGAERAKAAQELGRIGGIQYKLVEEAIEPLLNALKKDTDANVRQASATALAQIAPDASKVVPTLTESLKDKALGVQIAAVNALAAYGPEASSALPELRELSKATKDKKLTVAIKLALKSIMGKKK